MLTKDAILAAQDLPAEDVDVPEWGGAVRVRGMTAAERDGFETTCFDGKGKLIVPNFRAQLVARCVVDEAGARIFGDAEIDVLGGKSGAAVDRLFDVALRLSGMEKPETLKGN